MRPNSITVHVERLVLDGVLVGAHDGGLVGAAVQAGLGRLLGDDATALHAHPGALDVPAVTVPVRDDPAQFGDAVARAVHQGIRNAQAAQPPGGGGTAP